MKLQRRLLAIVQAFCSVPAWPQSVCPEKEYRKPIGVDEETKPLGENPLGKSSNLYGGLLSFTQIDIRLTGIRPTIEITRTLRLMATFLCIKVTTPSAIGMLRFPASPRLFPAQTAWLGLHVTESSAF
ncbi:hypothetical protein [Dyella sp. 20L07]|uniref:hypothetical protein n=1 Tax=Dyella sp. 20L07 TaxID=3384240 RepID=UPI003D2B35A5